MLYSTYYNNSTITLIIDRARHAVPPSCFASMKFQYPYLLIGILPLIACWWLLVKRKAPAREVRRSPLLLLSLIFLLVAIANPYWSTVQETRTEKGANLILMVDVSQSMFCPDGSPTRIDQARSFLRSILPQLAGSPVAVIYFAGDAQLGSPLTTDIPAIYLFLDSIVPAMTTEPGTRATPLESVTRDLIAEVTSRQTSRRQIGMLFSDGEFFDSNRGFRSWLSDQTSLTLFAFPCGKGESPVPKYDLSGPYPGAISKPNPAILKELAELTGGASYPLSKTNATAVSQEIFRHVSEVIAHGKIVPRYQYYSFLLMSFFFLLFYQLLPVFSHSMNRTQLAGSLALVLFLIVSPAAGKVQNNTFQKALDDMKQGRLDEAEKKLKDVQKQGNTEEVEIALGNVLLRKNQPEAAIRHYRNALRMNPFDQLARWNWEVALKQQSGPKPPPPQEQPPPPVPTQLPQEDRALLNYFDEMEKQDRKQENLRNANEKTFAW